MQALEDIRTERLRQVVSEGWSPEHDDSHDTGEIADAAACYAMTDMNRERPFRANEPPQWWPWEARWWKPGDRRRELVKAGALILAEIERLDRAAEEN